MPLCQLFFTNKVNAKSNKKENFLSRLLYNLRMMAAQTGRGCAPTSCLSQKERWIWARRPKDGEGDSVWQAVDCWVDSSGFPGLRPLIGTPSAARPVPFVQAGG